MKIPEDGDVEMLKAEERRNGSMIQRHRGTEVQGLLNSFQ